MLITEILEDNRIHHYSDKEYFIRQIETSNLYEDAVDIQPCRYTYEETNIPINELDISQEIPVWEEPANSYNGYMTGDKVWYPNKNNKIYSSLIDNNVWSPEVSGLWKEE